MNFVLVPNIDSLQILFLVLQLNLLVTKLLSQSLFFLIKMQEYLNISVKFSLLLILNYLFDFSLLHNVLLLFFEDCLGLFANFHFDL
jgi:hypothetical protein